MTEDAQDDSALARGLEAQLERWRSRLEEGAERVGWKIAINDPHAQARVGLSHPAIGYLTSRQGYRSGDTLPTRSGAMLRAEAEIAIFVGRDLPGGASASAARAAIDGIGPALEIVDRGRPAHDLVAVLADNVFHEAVVFGSQEPVRSGASLKGIAASLRRNGETVAEGDRRLAPGDLGALVKLVADLLARHGETLLAGDRILSGSLVQPAKVGPGDSVVADLGPLGCASVRIEAR